MPYTKNNYKYYEGDFHNDSKQGNGILYYENPNIIQYYGVFVNDLRDGFGTLYFKTLKYVIKVNGFAV